jgi:hypothetical protein
VRCNGETLQPRERRERQTSNAKRDIGDVMAYLGIVVGIDRSRHAGVGPALNVSPQALPALFSIPRIVLPEQSGRVAQRIHRLVRYSLQIWEFHRPV